MRSSVARAVVAVILSVLSALAAAQIRLELPSSGKWEAWIGQGEPGDTANFSSDSNKLDVPTAGSAPTDVISVWDGNSGNLASKELRDIDGVWKVSLAEFNRIGRLRVSVSHEGDPVASANVILKAGAKTQRRLLTPSGKGVVTFTNVAAGPIEVTIETTNKAGESVPVPKQSFRVDLKRDEPEPTLRVAIAEPVDVVSAEKQGASGDSQPAPAQESSPAVPPSGGSQMDWVSFLLGFAVIGGLGYAAWKFLPRYQNQVDTQLAKLGVQIPKDDDVQAQAADDPAPTVQPTRQPTPTILLGDDAQVSPAVPAPSPVPTVAAVAMLVNTKTGQRVQLADGEHLVSREAGAPISLEGSAAVSRRHAEIVREAGALKVRDLGSTNGTFLNSVKVEGEAQLAIGDVVQFGDQPFRVEAL